MLSLVINALGTGSWRIFNNDSSIGWFQDAFTSKDKNGHFTNRYKLQEAGHGNNCSRACSRLGKMCVNSAFQTALDYLVVDQFEYDQNRVLQAFNAAGWTCGEHNDDVKEEDYHYKNGNAPWINPNHQHNIYSSALKRAGTCHFDGCRRNFENETCNNDPLRKLFARADCEHPVKDFGRNFGYNLQLCWCCDDPNECNFIPPSPLPPDPHAPPSPPPPPCLDVGDNDVCD